MSASRRPPALGKVTLVGAGPGSPDLLTVRAARALAEADLVLFDALVDPAVLELAPRAARFSVGKRAGAHSVSQERIHAIMIRAARAGRRVVRLKAGDPFVLGRGGEEVLALGERGIPVEVVPGLSSALAAPLDAGIPVTHRGVASAFVVASAVPEGAFARLAAALPDRGVTLVVLMGLRARRAVRDVLAASGWPADKPAAIVLGAGGADAWSWTGTLDALADVDLEGTALPGVLVIGDVVGVARDLRRVLGAAPLAPPAHARPETASASSAHHEEKRLGS
jgi:uroporphyrin-III C-methyltransferase